MHFAQTLQATLRFHSWNEREQKTEEKLPVAFAWNLERVQLCVRVACGSALMSQCISCEEFDDDKASGKLDIALGKVPQLQSPCCRRQSRVDPCFLRKPSTIVRLCYYRGDKQQNPCPTCFQVPVLEVGDFSLPQSKAIERYLARSSEPLTP